MRVSKEQNNRSKVDGCKGKVVRAILRHARESGISYSYS